MASTERDAKELKSWEEAFNCPIATTRQIEKQLRNDIAANKERLRTLVGSSYRDLLGTADRIIHLDERMQETEKLLGDVSLQCNLDIIDQKARHLAGLQEQTAQQKSGGRHLIAQLSLLQKCQDCLPRLFRRGASLLTAANVLAVSRLLNKRIGQEDDAPPLLESVRGQLMSQRRRLLRRVDLILVDPKSSLHQLIEATCAFCIVTSSSSSDAIRHFHELRLDEIRRLSNISEKGREDVLGGFEYYLQSLRTTTKLLGRQFLDAMRDLRSQPLLRSPDIQSLDDLDIASVQQFIPPEILSFVRWIKHPDGQESEMASVLEKWSNAAFREVCLGLKRAVDGLSDTSELLDFRARLLQIWLLVSSSTSTHSNPGVFEALRCICNTRIKDLLHAKARSLSAIASEIEAALKRAEDSTVVSSVPIWDHDFVAAPLGKGATSYKRQLVDRHLGQSKSTNTILASLQHWTAAMSTSLEKIQMLRTTRWIDFIEEDDDDDDRTEGIERTLQRDDPDMYEQEHTSSLGTAIIQFQNRIKKFAGNLNQTETRKAIFLVRTIRGIYSHLATWSLQQQDLTILSSAAPQLHQLLATNITATLLDSIKPSSFVLKKQKIKALSHLWEGDPPLPTHPSPPVFKLLQRLTSIMADQGSDLWSTDAVDALKRAVREGIMESRLFPRDPSEPVNGAPDKLPPVNGNGPTHQAQESESGPQQHVSIQYLFDLLYLSHALGIPEGTSDTPTKSVDPGSTALESRILHSRQATSSHLDSAAMTVLEGRARGYWARTGLLFGFLA